MSAGWKSIFLIKNEFKRSRPVYGLLTSTQILMRRRLILKREPNTVGTSTCALTSSRSWSRCAVIKEKGNVCLLLEFWKTDLIKSLRDDVGGHRSQLIGNYSKEFRSPPELPSSSQWHGESEINFRQNLNFDEFLRILKIYGGLSMEIVLRGRSVVNGWPFYARWSGFTDFTQQSIHLTCFLDFVTNLNESQPLSIKFSKLINFISGIFRFRSSQCERIDLNGL